MSEEPTISHRTPDLGGTYDDPQASRREVAALERRVAMLERALLAPPVAPVPAYPLPAYRLSAGR